MYRVHAQDNRAFLTTNYAVGFVGPLQLKLSHVHNHRRSGTLPEISDL